MSTHRIHASTPAMRRKVIDRTASLTVDEIREALHPDHRHLVPKGAEVAMTHISTGVVETGHRAAVFAEVNVFEPVRSTSPALVSWVRNLMDSDQITLDRIELVEKDLDTGN